MKNINENDYHQNILYIVKGINSECLNKVLFKKYNCEFNKQTACHSIMNNAHVSSKNLILIIQLCII